MSAFSWSEVCMVLATGGVWGGVALLVMAAVCLLIKKITGFEFSQSVKYLVFMGGGFIMVRVCSDNMPIRLCG
ncbi:hypothetical protein [Pseudomonas sp. Z3-6]|uniref:hypothetical protein n=1 Tax=Pseudomonas sp. Z3-6 TaxID=2817411 RepID=UPI003DA94DA0